MRSPLVRLEVVPSSNKERFEKSLIGQLFNSGPESSPRIPKTKDPPPPVKAKPVFKPPETPSMRLTEDPALLEAPVSVSLSPCVSDFLKYFKMKSLNPKMDLFDYTLNNFD